MNKIPKVSTTSSGYILFRDSQEAVRVAQENAKKDRPQALTQEKVHQRALKLAEQNGINQPDLFTSRGFYEIQLGKYRGQTFHWLMENAIGYASYLVCDMEKEGGSTPQTPLGDNKRQLKLYMESFPAGRRAIMQKKKELESKRQTTPSATAVITTGLSSQVVPKRVAGLSTMAKTEPNIQSSSVAMTKQPSSDIEIGDDELVSQVEAMERSLHATSASADIAPQSPFEGKAVSISKVHTLSKLCAQPGLTGLLSQPDEYPLPEGWKLTLPQEDHKWVSKALFRYGKTGNLELQPAQLAQLWYLPPQPVLIPNQIPNIDRYFAHPLLLWMPRRLWHVRLHCPHCNDKELTSAGIYPRVRQVVDVAGYYNLATEYLECRQCKRKLIAWSGNIVSQLDVGHRYQFPVLLTYRYACDVKVITLLRTRGLGNSASQLHRKLVEEHSQQWLAKTCHYLSDCKGFTDSRLIVRPVIEDPPVQIPVPKYRWLQTVYCNDVMNRIEEVKAAITSTFGRVLKIDSTKKVAKKLAGHSANTATWATNVGNEDGQVLMSVLTCQEGYGLGPMVRGIIDRYSMAGIPPPEVLYVDRDCCGDNIIRQMFRPWADLKIRLDIWHFMRRFSSSCTTDAHQLYGVFMARLSKCIFEWSSEDLQKLRDAKRSELLQKHINPSTNDIIRHLSKRELTLHCRRQTRGSKETTRLIGDLIESFTGEQGLDTMGVPLFDKEKILSIWESQKKHVPCIQDPEGFSLYAQVGVLKKGDIRLPIYRCARGSTSLESFHLHLARFIPGTTASDMHFQTYLLDGLVRWNEDRCQEVSKSFGTATYSGLLRHAVNDLSQNILAKNIIHDYQPPRKYTGEKIGVEYLYSQTGQVLHDFTLDPDNKSSAQFESDGDMDTDENEDEDQGFEDTLEDLTLPPIEASQIAPPSGIEVATSTVRNTPMIAPPTTTKDDHQSDNLDPNDAVGPDNIGGFQHVELLAEYLFSLRDHSRALTNDGADHLIQLWKKLSDYDKRPTVPSPRHRDTLAKGRFKARSKTSVVPGVDSTRRCFLGQGAGPAQRPDSNRYMESTIIKLCSAYPSSTRTEGKTIQRWTKVTQAYKGIRETVLSNARVMSETNISLLEINNATLMQWYNKRSKDQERQMLEQGLRLPIPAMEAPRPLPPPRTRVPLTEKPSVPPHVQHEFVLPPITTGLSGNIRKRHIAPVESPANPESTLPRVPQPTSPLECKKLPRSTDWYRKRQERKRAEGEYVRQYRRPATSTYTCKKCGKLRTSEKHAQYYGQWYCALTASENFEQWRSLKEKCRNEKKRKTDHAEGEQL